MGLLRRKKPPPCPPHDWIWVGRGGSNRTGLYDIYECQKCQASKRVPV